MGTHIADLVVKDEKNSGVLFDDRLVTWGQLWLLSGSVGSFGQRHGTRIAALLPDHPHSLAAAVGALRAGMHLASLPHPGRGANLDRYIERLTAAVVSMGADVVLVGGEVAGLLPPQIGGVQVRAFDELFAYGASCQEPGDGEFVQYTSGTTAANKGVRLDGQRIGANVKQIRSCLELDEHISCVTWLPMAHDMGIMGTGMVMWAAGGSTVQLTPQQFSRDPLSWIDAMSSHGAHATAVPNFALDMAVAALARHPGRAERWDLSRLDRLIVGSERVAPETLRRFQEVFAPSGFVPDTSFRPAYGMAEMVLAISMSPRGAAWETHDFQGSEHVALGPPLEGNQVTEDAGELSVDGPSRMIGYLGQPASDGPLATRDAGCVTPGGQVVVTGRTDDLIVTRGVKLWPHDIEAACAGLVRAGCCVAVQGAAGYRIVAEAGNSGYDASIAAQIRRSCVSAVGVAPEEIVFIERGRLTKTSSGKPQRRSIAHELDAGQLPIVCRHKTRKS